jgi:hypothetical protein
VTDGENGPAPTQVSKVGPWAAAWMYLFLVALGLLGPFLMVLGVFAGQGVVITGMVCTVVLVPLGFVAGLTVAAERRHNRRLDAFGVPATAQTLRPGHAQPGGVRTPHPTTSSLKPSNSTPPNSGQSAASMRPGAVHDD